MYMLQLALQINILFYLRNWFIMLLTRKKLSYYSKQ